MADQFESFNCLAKTTQQYPMLSPQDLEDRFREVDRLLNLGIRALLATTHFVEDSLCYRLTEIAAGRLKSKIYKGRFVKSRRSVGEGVEVGAENSKILGTGFDLFKLSRTSRSIASPLVLRVLRNLRLQNLTYEQILRAFCTTTKDYRKISEQLVLEKQELRCLEQDENPELVIQLKKISGLIDQKMVIESRAGCANENSFYGTVALAHRYMQQIDRAQGRVVKAYLRSIPRVVREYAQSDLDALDLFQAGSFGLMHAVKAYDFRSPAGFVGFARRWIRERVRKSIRKSMGPLIRLSPNVWEDVLKINQAQREIEKEQPGHEVSAEQIAEHLGWSVEKVNRVLEKRNMSRLSSLEDEQTVDQECVERVDTIADEQEAEREALAMHRQHVKQIISHLAPKDRRLICLHHGCIDLIENDDIDPFQALEEMLRQLACKALMHQYLAGCIDDRQDTGETIIS